MKKTYMTPALMAVKIETTGGMLAGSLGQKSTEASASGEYYDNQLGRGDDGDWEDEEF